jgi:hypothetical protein
MIAALNIVAFLVGCNVALADPVGRYDCEGTNPGKDTGYKCTVVVERTGDTYSVKWNVGDKEFIAVSYSSGNQTGLALYAPEGDNWQGVWTYAGGRRIGAERWVRR